MSMVVVTSTIGGSGDEERKAPTPAERGDAGNWCGETPLRQHGKPPTRWFA
jgi:hypothetical protein